MEGDRLVYVSGDLLAVDERLFYDGFSELCDIHPSWTLAIHAA
jgi:hypothetical protein